MRYAVYLVAVLAAAGLVYVISQPPQPTAPEVASPAEAPAQPDAAAPAVAENVVAENAERVTLNVPEMHCPVACYPAVKFLPNGQNVHCTVKPPEWWAGLFHAIAMRHTDISFRLITSTATGRKKKFGFAKNRAKHYQTVERMA